MKSESEVAQSCLTLRDPMDCSLPGSSVHGILQARLLQWVAIAFSQAFTWVQLMTRQAATRGPQAERQVFFSLVPPLPLAESPF